MYPTWNAAIIRFKGAGDVLPNTALLISPLSTHTHYVCIIRHKNITGLRKFFTHSTDRGWADIDYVILNIKNGHLIKTGLSSPAEEPSRKEI